MRLPFNGNFPLTQGFGVNPQNYTQFMVGQLDGTTGPMKGHDGLDYGLPSGTEVLAPHSGKIIESAFDANGYGNYIKIENDVEGSVLAHLQEAKVPVGFVVAEGELIGISDQTGYVIPSSPVGAHLHWGYYRFPRNRNNGYAGFIDQTPFLPQEAVVQSAQVEQAAQPVAPDPHPMQPVLDQAILDQLRRERDTNWNLYQDQKGTTQKLQDKLMQVQEEVSTFTNENTGLKQQIIDCKNRNIALANEVAKTETEDVTAIDSGLKAEEQLKEQARIVNTIAGVVGANKSTLKDILSAYDRILSSLWNKIKDGSKPKIFTPSIPLEQPPAPKKSAWGIFGL